MNNLNFLGPCNVLGYGTASFNLLIHLSELYNITYWPIGDITYPIVKDTHRSIIQKAINNQEVFDHSAPSLRIWHQHDMAQHVGTPKIGFPIFELNRFSSREKHHLGSLEKIFVPSLWARGVVDEQIGVEAHIVRLGVDREIFFADEPKKDGPYIFLNVGKWEIRKGHDVLIEAFNNAFTKADNVELWMMNHNPFLTKEQEAEWIKFYKDGPLGDKVKILPRVQTQMELATIMRKAHCGVFPARAEGWNLEALEMLSCGRQLIVTDYSAHTEFCNDKNAHLIEIDSLESAWDGIWFKDQGEWAKLGPKQLDSLTASMLECYKQGPRLNTAGTETANLFSWRASALAAQKGIEH